MVHFGDVTMSFFQHPFLHPHQIQKLHGTSEFGIFTDPWMPLIFMVSIEIFHETIHGTGHIHLYMDG